jgi:hypothetical protein
MIEVLGENYFIDLDQIEKYIDIEAASDFEISGGTEMRINIIKYEMIKTLLEVILSEDIEMDEKLGTKGNNNISIPFKIAFNSLLNKKLINYY